MSQELAIAFVLIFFVLPVAHVIVSPRGGRWSPPPDGGCPFGPRTGWLIIVLIAGPIGWLMYMRGRRAKSFN